MPTDTLSWLAAGYLVVWVALGGYLFRLWRAQRRIDDRLRRLEGDRTDPETRGPPTGSSG